MAELESESDERVAEIFTLLRKKSVAVLMSYLEEIIRHPHRPDVHRHSSRLFNNSLQNCLRKCMKFTWAKSPDMRNGRQLLVYSEDLDVYKFDLTVTVHLIFHLRFSTTCAVKDLIREILELQDDAHFDYKVEKKIRCNLQKLREIMPQLDISRYYFIKDIKDMDDELVRKLTKKFSPRTSTVSKSREDLLKYLKSALEKERPDLQGQHVRYLLRNILPDFRGPFNYNTDTPGSFLSDSLQQQIMDYQDTESLYKNVGPYFNKQRLQKKNFKPLDDPKEFEKHLSELKETSPSNINYPEEWNNIASLIDALRRYRNDIYHFGSDSMSQTEFERHTKNILNVLTKLDGKDDQNVEPGAKSLSVILKIQRLLRKAEKTPQDDSDLESLDQAESSLRTWRQAEKKYKEGNYKDALKLFRHTLYRDSGAEATESHYRVALCQWNLGNQDKARSSFKRALHASRKATIAQTGTTTFIEITYASFLLHAGEHEEAKKILDGVSGKSGNDWHYHFVYGNLHSKLSDRKKAIDAYKKAVDLLGDGKPLQWAIVVSALAAQHVLQSEHVLAYDAYSRIYRQLQLRNTCNYPDKEYLIYNLVNALNHLSYRDEALDAFELLKTKRFKFPA